MTSTWYSIVFGIDAGKDLAKVDPKFFVNHVNNTIVKRDIKAKYVCGRDVEKFFWLIENELSKKEDWALTYRDWETDRKSVV